MNRQAAELAACRMEGPDRTQLTLFPAEQSKMTSEAKKANMALDGSRYSCGSVP